THEPVHGFIGAGGAALALPASHLFFTDGSGEDREVAVPAVALAAGGTAGVWVDEAGDAFAADPVPAPGAPPNLSTQVAAATIPWAVRQAGYRIDVFATNLQLPVNVAFVPNPGPNPDDPYLYVTELYGSVQMVTRSGAVSPYATGLLNFDP